MVLKVKNICIGVIEKITIYMKCIFVVVNIVFI